FFLAGWILLILAILYYRSTLPPLSGFRRWLLIALRTAALLIVLFLLLQPVLQMVYEKQSLPTLAVLLDNSKSMKIREGSGERADSVKYILQNARFDRYSDSLNVRVFTFDNQLHRYSNDTLGFAGSQTNISRALENISDSLSQQNLQAIVLVSDGQFNQGANPLQSAATSPVPIYTVAVGDSVSQKDIRITGVQASRVAYAGDNVPVEVSVMQRGFQGGEMIVSLRDDKRLIEAKTVRLPASGFEQKVKFDLHAGKPGQFRYTVEVGPQKDEITDQNNRSSFLINVLKSKVQALLISGAPSFDERMLIFALHQLPTAETTVLTEKNTGQYYQGDLQTAPLDSQDVFIFLGFPTARSSDAQVNRIFSMIQKKKIPCYFMLTRETSLSKLSPYNSMLPFNPASGLVPDENVIVSLTPGGRLHPVTRLDENISQLTMLWKELPPVTAYGRSLRLKEGSTILLRDQAGLSSYPVLTASVNQDVKSLVLAAANFGGWHFQLQDDARRDGFFRDFMDRSIKWLVNREDIQRLQIHPSQEIYRAGEPVEFSGQVMDEFYKPVNDAEVSIVISSENYQQNDVLVNQSGFYNYRTAGLPPGTYEYALTARRGERNIGSARGKFVIQELELEMQDVEANPRLMHEIAMQSGGESFSARQFLRHLGEFRFKKQIHMSSIEHVLWNKIYWLIAVIFLLSVEWFLRKRWGLL
ncbi:MAG: hypothetical protein P8184_16240, partial [Calditrichia bacterium]